MRRAGASGLAALVAAVAIGVTAGASPAARQTSPTAWAHVVCTSVSGWNATIQKRAAGLNHLNGNDVPRVKAKLVAFLTAVVSDTQGLIATIQHAGTPSIPKGAAAAHALVQGLSKTKAFFAQDAARAKKLPLKPATKFLAGETALGRSITAQNRQIATIFSSLKKLFPSKALTKAFKADAACASLK